jgi:PAP2 superfamily C-terminal
VRPRWQTILFRAAFVVVGLAAWFWTQSLIGARAQQPDSSNGIGDGIHELLAVPHQFLVDHPHVADWLLIFSSAVIDLVGIFLLAASIFGPSIRPFLGLLLVFAMRQICQMLCALPPPTGMIWRYPGFPTLLVTYDVSTDFFFSGHTALAVLGAVELTRIMGRRWLLVGILIVLFEATTVLLVRAHYTMDVFTGAVAARYATLLADRWAPWCDAWLGGLK